jgi:hypothetical protein
MFLDAVRVTHGRVVDGKSLFFNVVPVAVV